MEQMWISKDSDDTVVLHEGKPEWDEEFGVWISEEWESEITNFKSLYSHLPLTEKEPLKIELIIKESL